MLAVSRHRHRPLAPWRVMIILRFLRRIAGLGGGPPPPPARQHRLWARARTRQARRIGIQIAFFCHPPRSLTDPLPTRQGFLSRAAAGLRSVSSCQRYSRACIRLLQPVGSLVMADRTARHAPTPALRCHWADRAKRQAHPAAHGARYCSPPPRLNASSASSIVGSLVADTLVDALVEATRASRPAAVDSSGASNSTYRSASPNAYEQPCSVPPSASTAGAGRRWLPEPSPTD